MAREKQLNLPQNGWVATYQKGIIYWDTFVPDSGNPSYESEAKCERRLLSEVCSGVFAKLFYPQRTMQYLKSIGYEVVRVTIKEAEI